MLGHRTGRVIIVFIVFTNYREGGGVGASSGHPAFGQRRKEIVRLGTGVTDLALNPLLRKQFPAGDPIWLDDARTTRPAGCAQGLQAFKSGKARPAHERLGKGPRRVGRGVACSGPPATIEGPEGKPARSHPRGSLQCRRGYSVSASPSRLQQGFSCGNSQRNSRQRDGDQHSS
jgi:hypothetical protein